MILPQFTVILAPPHKEPFAFSWTPCNGFVVEIRLTMRRSAFCALLMLRHAAGFHEHHSPSRIPTPTPTHDPTPTWEPTTNPNPSAAPTPAPTINDPGVIEKIWFTFVDVDRLDVRVSLPSFHRWLEQESLTHVCLSDAQVQWEMPTGYDDEGLRIKKYEVEVRQLRTHVARYWSTDLDDLTHSFTVCFLTCVVGVWGLLVPIFGFSSLT